MVHGTPKYNPFEMGGPRWNKVGTGYVQSGLTTKTPFTVQKMSKLGPQEVPKEVQMVQNSTYGAVMVQGAQMVGTRLERGMANQPITNLQTNKCPNWVPRRSQTGFKWSKIVFIGFKWSKVSHNCWNMVE